MILSRIKGSNIKYEDGGKFDTSKLTYRKNLKLSKAPFSVEKSSKITGSKKVNGKTEYTTGKKVNLNSLIPYASNAYNAFRKLPKPIASQMESPISANLINLDAARNNIDTNQRVLNRETDYRVSNPAVAQAIKATTMGKAIQGRNELTQEEGNSNAQIKNQTNQFNQGIYARNIERTNQFNRDTIQRDIAQQNLLSENLANIGDKYQEQQRDKSQMELEDRRLGYLKEFYNPNEGFYQRMEDRNLDTQKEKYFKGEFGGKINLVSRYNHLYGKANSGIYAFGGEVDPSKPSRPISKDDFTHISWKSQGVNDSTGRAPMYKTTNAAFYGLNKAPIPQGVDPNEEVYPQIDSLDRKLNSSIGKPIVSYARDIYGNIAPSDQGRVVSRFKDGGKVPVSNSLLEYYENTAQPVTNIGETNSRLRDLNVRLVNRNKRFYKDVDNITKTKFGSGGTIHINPANKGKFNALKARTGKSTEELTHSKNPLTRKRAIFAQNAKKWHH